jgi:iron complex transport system substrate-binding protein
MTRIDLSNALAVISCVASAMAAAGRPSHDSRPATAAAVAVAPSLRTTVLPGGEKALLDRRGRAVPLRRYERILSGSSVADELLVDLAERDRILAITSYGKKNSLAEQTAAGLATHPGLANVEAILSLKPDLIITNHIGDPALLERLEERGIPVFDLGEMRGMATLVGNIQAVATLLGRPEAGLIYAERLRRRLASVSRGDHNAGSCMYLSAYGGQLFGGTVGSSYHDVIVAAGLSDAAASNYHDWPNYSVEDVLALDPEFILASNGMNETLCRQPGFETLRACRERARILMLPDDLVGDPGPRMLDAAEALRAELDARSP